jgi:hypothetical protein
MIDQTSQFFAILTNIGTAKQANADALGVAWKITQMGVGDANGTDPIPSATQTTLINERRRAPLNQLKVDPNNSAIIVAEQVIPEDVGGWWIREIGLYDADGDLVAIANCAPSFKPLLTQGSGRTQVVRMNLIVSNSSNVELRIDPSVVLATRSYVDAKVLEELNKLDSKQSVLVATTANIALAGLQTIDGVAVPAGARVLVKNQTVPKDNGIYLAAAAVWTRAPDADTNAEVTSALLTSVEQGATLADTRWQLITDGLIVVGTTALTFQNVTQGFAPIISPALISPTATSNPPQFDNSLLLATAGFVQRALGSYSAYAVTNASAALSAVHVGNIVLPTAGGLTFTLPPAAGIAAGSVVTLYGNSVGATIVPASGVITSNGVGVSSIVLGPFDTIQLTLTASSGWYVTGGSAQLIGSSVMSGPNWTTRPQFDNTKSLATTEFVQRALGSLSGVADIGNGASANAGHVGKNLNIGAGSSNLPAAASVPDGATLNYKNTGIGSHTLNRAGTDIISCDGSNLTSIVVGTGEDLKLVQVGNNWIGSGSAALKYGAGFQTSLLANGWQKLPSGKIEQWGATVAIPAGGSAVVTLPFAMPANILTVEVTAQSSTNDTTPISGAWNAINAGTFTLRNKSTVASIFSWTAIGW